MEKKAVLFDLDGTLLNTIEGISEAMNLALANNGLPIIPDVERHKYLVGLGVDVYVKKALPEDKKDDEELFAAVKADYVANYSRMWKDRTRPYDGIEEMLDELKRGGFKLAILSNKPDQITRLTVEEFFDLDKFEIVRGALDGVPLKPDPSLAIEIAREMQINPNDFAYLGDTGIDMQTANAAGMFAVGATWGFRKPDELIANGAKVLINHPLELSKVLQNNRQV